MRTGQKTSRPHGQAAGDGRRRRQAGLQPRRGRSRASEVEMDSVFGRGLASGRLPVVFVGRRQVLTQQPESGFGSFEL